MIAPMLASLADAPLDDPQLVYEPKYDGIRAIIEIAPKGRVRLWSRLGNDKTGQFPEISAALAQWARRRTQPLVLDGEIVALDAKGQPAGFQQLQGRIHLTEGDGAAGARTALIAFDLLKDGATDYRDRPLLERRAALEKVFGRTGSPMLRISDQVRGDGRALYRQAMEQGWEGLIAKDAASLYKSGKRSPEWRKLKIVHEQEFVIGGWTEPRQTRAYFGALLLGVYEADRLVYAGHTGTGFTDSELARLMKRLKPLETKTSPFSAKLKTNQRPHWVRPELVAQIKFTEWTADGKLRHPVYLGLRDDKQPAEVTREQQAAVVRRSAFEVRRPEGAPTNPATRGAPNAARATANGEGRPTNDHVIEQLSALESARKDGVLTLPDGATLKVTNLQKPFWPKLKLTKGDLMRYYARIAPFIIPAVADRPLVMKRFPNGVGAPPFYQHRAPDVPPGVRTEVVGALEERPQIIGGSLTALLYMTQLAAISQDPWFSRVAHPEFADYAAFDLDPSDGVPFARVLDVARWIRDELDALGATGIAKTSGSDGLHIYIALPPGTPYEAGMLYCQIVAAMVEQKHPKVATTERSVKARGKRIYIDCLQNILGKTLATAYSARASLYAGVSTPVTWQEIDEGFDRTDFTITTVPARFDKVGDLWAKLRTSKGVDLKKIATGT
ncbi:MAG: putative ligase-like protein [Acidobacteria bacterium]|nr:putative ligase-like protein [Acidobacteriota bacterium]